MARPGPGMARRRAAVARLDGLPVRPNRGQPRGGADQDGLRARRHPLRDAAGACVRGVLHALRRAHRPAGRSIPAKAGAGRLSGAVQPVLDGLGPDAKLRPVVPHPGGRRCRRGERDPCRPFLAQRPVPARAARTGSERLLRQRAGGHGPGLDRRRRADPLAGGVRRAGAGAAAWVRALAGGVPGDRPARPAARARLPVAARAAAAWTGRRGGDGNRRGVGHHRRPPPRPDPDVRGLLDGDLDLLRPADLDPGPVHPRLRLERRSGRAGHGTGPAAVRDQWRLRGRLAERPAGASRRARRPAEGGGLRLHRLRRAGRPGPPDARRPRRPGPVGGGGVPQQHALPLRGDGDPADRP